MGKNKKETLKEIFDKYRGSQPAAWLNCLPGKIDDKKGAYWHDEHVYQSILICGINKYCSEVNKINPQYEAYSVYHSLMRRARYLQVNYYPLAIEILSNFDNHIHNIKERTRQQTSKLIKSGELVVDLSHCRNCGTSGKILKHHPNPFDPKLIMPLCTACHALWHRDNPAKIFIY